MSLSNKVSTKLLVLRRFFRILSLICILGSFSWLLYKTAKSSIFRIWDVRVSGQEQLSEEAIRHLADIHYGTHAWYVDTRLAKEKIEKYPWIRKADVHWNFPSTIEISIEEEEIKALLSLEKMWYVNPEGEPFHLAQNNSLDYPIITGIPHSWPNRYPVVVKKIIAHGLHILDICGESPLLQPSSISEIYFQKDLGFSIILQNGSKIIFGFYDPKDRVERLSQMVESGLDLSEPKQIVLDAEKVAVVIPLN